MRRVPDEPRGKERVRGGRERAGELAPALPGDHAETCMIALRTSPAGFPMAPTAEEWEALSPDERAAVVAALPAEVTYDEMAMPEGDRHTKARARALDALRGYFSRQRRRIIYVATEMP